MIKKKFRAWALVENEKVGHYYSMLQVYPSRAFAKVNATYYNAHPLNHKFKIKRIEITILK